MKFFSKRKLAIMLTLCSVLNSKNNFASGLTKPQKAGIITVSSLLGLGVLSFGSYRIYKYFNPDNPDDSGKKDDKSKNNKELFSQDEVKKILEDDLPKGEIKSIEDLNKLMVNVTNTLWNSNDCRNICKNWCKEIFERNHSHVEDFEYEDYENVGLYTLIDTNSSKLKEIEQFMVKNAIPDIFGAAEKLGKKIVPVFQIKIKGSKSPKISLYFACQDKYKEYLISNYRAYGSNKSDVEYDDD